MRDLDLATLQPSASYAGLWTDYAQDTAHGDQIGTSRFMINASAQTARRAVYTAFGELVMADDGHGQPAAASRYGYAGAWGYETGLDDAGEPDLPPLPFIHVGERWYDPSSGRFLQRDPIGIIGGLNVFIYLENNSAIRVDPTGMSWLGDLYQMLPLGFHEVVGGGGHVPVLDPGPAQTVVLTCANVASFAAPVGAGARAATLTPKALKAARTGWCGKYLVRIRRVIRYDRVPHHGKDAGHWHFPWHR